MEIPQTEISNTVAYYWDKTNGWDWNKLNYILPADQLDKLAAVIIDEDMNTEDTLGWGFEASGKFSVSFAYSIIIQNSEEVNRTDSLL